MNEAIMKLSSERIENLTADVKLTEVNAKVKEHLDQFETR